jgi:hypothetical protein
MTLKINPPGKCGREHNRLAVGPAVVDDPHDLGLETHVEHAVGLVEDDVGDAAQVRHLARVGRQHVDHTARRAHDDFRACAQYENLERQSAKNG